MDEAVQLRVTKGQSLGMACNTVNKKHGCRIARMTLADHAEAFKEGLAIGRVGRPWGESEGGEAFIPQEIVDIWAGWLAISASDNGCHILGVAESMLLDLCEDNNITLGKDWQVKLPRCFWMRLQDKEGYGYPDLRGRLTKNLCVARRWGEAPDRIRKWAARIKTEIISELHDR